MSLRMVCKTFYLQEKMLTSKATFINIAKFFLIKDENIGCTILNQRNKSTCSTKNRYNDFVKPKIAINRQLIF